MSPTTMPTWEGFSRPILEVMSDGVERSRLEIDNATIDHVGLTEEQRAEVLNSGQSRAFNRIGWAMSALSRAGALNRPRRARYVITDSGRKLLEDRPESLSKADLMALPEYKSYVATSKLSADDGSADDSVQPWLNAGNSDLDPVEQIDSGISSINSAVAEQLLSHLRTQDPDFLEQAVLDVLVAMGYGGAEQRVRRIGGTGDGGVDGVIDQDPLGLDQVYVQAKRYGADHAVGREAIQAFVGALHGNQASRGIFITTSRFASTAREYAERVSSRLILIDGKRLASLMIKYGIGTQVVRTYEVIEVDENYFE